MTRHSGAHFRLSLNIVCMVAILLCGAPAIFAQGNSGHTPKVVIDGDGSHMTPFAKGFSTSAQNQRNAARAHGNSACVDPSSSDSPGQRRNKAKACNVADVQVNNSSTSDCPDCGATNVNDGNGNAIGLQLKNQITVSYTNPSQRGDSNGNILTSWPPTAFSPNRKPSQPVVDGNGNTINPSNEDTSGNPIVPKTPDSTGQSLSGNAPDASQLNPHVTSVSQFHNNITPLSASDCANFGSGKTITPRDGTGMPLKDNQGNSITVTLPQQGFGTYDAATGTCDVSRAFIVAANMAYSKGKGDPNAKAFDADANGNCNPQHATNPDPNAAVGCGQERRTQHYTETYTAHCPANMQYSDGVCIHSNSSETLLERSSTLPASSGTLLQDNFALMGFTFAPPEVSWGYSVEEDACVDLLVTDVCVTLFAAKIGYDFDVAAGLRLPVQLEVNSPSGNTTPGNNLSVLAGNSLSLNTSLTPQDLTNQQYIDFCNSPGNHIADGTLIASCDTFGFPEFFSQTFHDIDSSIPVDGSEFVTKWVVFAGVKVVVLDVTLVDIGLDSAADLGTMCTLNQLINNKFSTAGSTALTFLETLGGGNPGTDALNSFLSTMKTNNLNCSSFTTPYGGSDDTTLGVTTTLPASFPWNNGGVHLYADCTKAAAKGAVVNIRGQSKPLCTGAFLDIYGVTVGIGLDFNPIIGSSEIKANWGSSGDGRISGNTDPNATSGLKFTSLPPTGCTTTTCSFNNTNPPIGPVAFDNYDTSTDYANVNVNNFTYLINTFTLQLNANLEFGGLASAIPNLPSFPILVVSFNTGDVGIPIPQHSGEGPLRYPVFVQNYGLSVAGSPIATTKTPIVPASQNTLNSNKPALSIKPGRPEGGSFNFQVKNEGSVSGSFENFAAVLPDTTGAFPFLAPGWTASFAQQTTSANAHSNASAPIPVNIVPLKDPSTRPQLYPITLLADSKEAIDNNMAAVDPSNIHRKGAFDTVYVNILPYYDPRISSDPPTSIAKPGAAGQAYAETVQNHGNAPDQIQLSYAAVDFNQAGCTLTTLGGLGCPYRSVPTAIPPAWTTASGLTTLFDPPAATPAVGDVGVLATRNTGFSITVPPDWAGMTDTTYTFAITVTSLLDDGAPPASNVVNIKQTVLATKQSMTRYIGLELADLALQIQNAQNAGVGVGGTLPIDVQAAQRTNDRALNSILTGDLGSASTDLSAEIRMMEAFVHSVDGPSLPANLLTDWTARATAILTDLGVAQVSGITSQARTLRQY